MNNILLSSTLHDPRGVFLNVLGKASKVVLEGYKGWVVNVTTTTDGGVKNTLRALAPHGVYMTETDVDHPIVPDKIENDHLFLLKQAVAIAKDLGVDKIQYTDGDRIITAATHFPEDLRKMAGKTSELLGNARSYINFRRSVEDYFSHHPPLVQTEFEINRLYSAVFGIPIDIGSTAHGMSLDVAEEILHRSPQMEEVSFPHPKWLIIAKEMGIPIRSEETQHVLTFETPVQFKKEVKERIGKAPTSYKELQQGYMATLGLDSTVSAREWNLRFNTEGQYLSLLRTHFPEFRDEIDRSLVSMEGRKGAIEEALKRPSNPEGK